MNVTMTVDDSALRRLVRDMRNQAENLDEGLAAVGNLVVADAQLCFRESRTPWGESWAPLKPSTLLNRSRPKTVMGNGILKGNSLFTGGSMGFAGLRSKDRPRIKKATRQTMGLPSSKPLLDTGALRNSITFAVEGNSVTVGTNLKQAGMLQFGASKGAFGKRSPWGNVPARPFLPVRPDGSAELPQGVRDEAVGLLTRHLFR